jgi:tetratricopeptide (TPR) repeat protein
MRAFLLVSLLGLSALGLKGQTIQLKNGQSIPAPSFQRKDDLLMVDVTSASGANGQVGYNVSDIAELDFPAPPELAAASDMLAKGHPDQALSEIEPVATLQETVRDIPGNWWAHASLIKCQALVALNRSAEAEPILTELASQAIDPESRLAAKLQLTLLAPPADPVQALAVYDAVINQSSDTKTLTLAWLAKGDLHYAQHNFDEALMAYLTVTVFYPENNPLLPRALWGAAQSYARLKDRKNQDLTMQELVKNYPDNPETVLARAEILKQESNQ